MEYEQFDYLITKPELSEEMLAHYGVPGMKWGVRKSPQKSGNGRTRKKRLNRSSLRTDGGRKVVSSRAFPSASTTPKKAKSTNSGSRKETAKRVLKAAGIAAGVTVGAMALYTFAHPVYGKGNRAFVAGKAKEFAYKQGRKFADSVVRRRNAKAMRRTVKSLPRIGAKPIVDTTFKDVTNTGLTRYTALAKRSNKPSAKDVAKVGAGVALVGAGAYADYKTRQAIKKRREANKGK